MICMQLYAKEIECPPGASTVASVFSRNLQNRGLDSNKPGEVKDLVWKICAWRDVMVFISQKIAIQKCNLDGKPVIITRVVDNMIDNLRPTRAEATDVANAVLDGTDGILLGAETVRGPYPVDVVSTVGRICAEVRFFSTFNSVTEPSDIQIFLTDQWLVAKYRPPMPVLAIVFPREGSDPTEYRSSCQLGPEDACSICLREYGSAPDINIYGDPTFIFPSLRAIQERHMNSDKNVPAVRIIVADGAEDVMLKRLLVNIALHLICEEPATGYWCCYQASHGWKTRSQVSTLP
ncbi:hypothetical protein ABZP36_030431 [Zizania latifolia]